MFTWTPESDGPFNPNQVGPPAPGLSVGWRRHVASGAQADLGTQNTCLACTVTPRPLGPLARGHACIATMEVGGDVRAPCTASPLTGQCCGHSYPAVTTVEIVDG